MNKKELITRTFMEMLGEMSLDAIRVQDIIERADVSKSTFYRLFLDKYDVMNSVHLAAADSIVNAMPDLKNWKEWTVVAFDHIKANKTFYRNVISYRGQNSFEEFLIWMYTRNNRRQIEKKSGCNQLPDDVLFAIEAFSRVNVFTTIWWINNNFQPDTETVIQYVEQCIPVCIKQYYE